MYLRTYVHKYIHTYLRTSHEIQALTKCTMSLSPLFLLLSESTYNPPSSSRNRYSLLFWVGCGRGSHDAGHKRCVLQIKCVLHMYIKYIHIRTRILYICMPKHIHAPSMCTYSTYKYVEPSYTTYLRIYLCMYVCMHVCMYVCM